ncbi:MAG: hypothetical protein H0S80_03100 [Desulfovibrionaceae bacterium]|nr:hypothetical protein [Desulfovibrionaceae bacterium]
MIDIAGAVPAILSRLKKLPAGRGLELLTFKRDRGLRVVKTGEDAFTATEFGFRAETVRADLKGMKRVLKTVLKREFPRSNKVRVRPLGEEQ